MDHVKALRHIEEKSGGLGLGRDGGIDSAQLHIVDDHYVPRIMEDVETQSPSRIRIISSDARRSIDTSDHLATRLGKKTLIAVELETDPRANALNHGVYRLDLLPDNPRVRLAKSIYMDETFRYNNPWYQYGSTRGGAGRDYSVLNEIFVQPGESQADLSIRFYRLFLDLLDRSKHEDATMIVLSTHYVVITRLLSLERIARAGADYPHRQGGELYLREWDAGNDVTSGYDFYEFFRVHNFIFDINIAGMDAMRGVVETDLRFLEQERARRYGS